MSYRIICFNNKSVRIEGSKVDSQGVQPSVKLNPNCAICKHRFTLKCNFCYIPPKSTIPTGYKKIERETMRGPQDTIIRVNVQWMDKLIRTGGTIQPMVDYDPICKECSDRYTRSCNTCFWQGDVSNEAVHTKFKQEEKGMSIEIMEVDVFPAYKLGKNFSFFKMVENGKIIFMGLAHKDNIKRFKELFEKQNKSDDEGEEEDEEIYHIPKDNLNILVTDKTTFVNLKNVDEKERDAIIDELFHLIATALTPEGEGETLSICVMCGEVTTNEDINLCDTCLDYYQENYPDNRDCC